MDFNEKVKGIAEYLLDAILIAVLYIFVVAALLLKFAILFIGIFAISAFVYSEVFGGNVDALCTMTGFFLVAVLTIAYWTVDYMTIDFI